MSLWPTGFGPTVQLTLGKSGLFQNNLVTPLTKQVYLVVLVSRKKKFFFITKWCRLIVFVLWVIIVFFSLLLPEFEGGEVGL